VFAREPVLGKVKTRLAKHVGDQAALALHRAFVADTVALARGVADRTVLAVAGDPDGFRDLEVERIAQVDGDLGARMSHAITSQLRSGSGPVCIIGSDAPTVPREDLVEAFFELKDRDIVLGPSTDGGYWLIGARVPIPELFTGIEWGTPLVLPQTMSRLQSRDYVLLGEHYDIDGPEDLAVLEAELAELPGVVAPATRDYLRRLGRLRS
jgi:hypothetical protein